MELVAALDSHTPKQLGENGHAEYAWSNEIQEQIIQLDFQCVRTKTPEGLAEKLGNLLRILSEPEKKEQNRDHLLLLYKMMGRTRDIKGGKGEYELAYMMVWEWYQYFPQLALQALSLFVDFPTEEDPYGSWKDIKYMCHYAQGKGAAKNHPIIQFCIQKMNTRVREDHTKLQADPNATISLCGRWTPRESSGKFGWLTEAFAIQYFPEYIATAKTEESKRKAVRKCLTEYRKIVTALNRQLDTVQIKQCGQRWSEIDHAKTTSITMMNQRKAFMNKSSNKHADNPDRVQCAENLAAYIESQTKKGKELKGGNIGLEMFTKQVLTALSTDSTDELAMIDSQWRDNTAKKNSSALENMIAVVDESGSMEGDPSHAARALGCRVAEKSTLGKRVMTFGSKPEWINLDGCTTFSQMIHTIQNCSHYAGTSTNFYAALDMILTVIRQKRIPLETVDKMVLAIFTDMQINACLYIENGGNCSAGYVPTFVMPEEEVISAQSAWQTLNTKITQKYADTGIELYGRPLTPPHILFWNLRNTTGFPTLSTEANCSMMSGYDPSLLNDFCELGMEGLKNFSPWKMLVKGLNKERYEPMTHIFNQYA